MRRIADGTKNGLLILFLMISLLSSVNAQKSTEQCKIKGRVIDEFNNPVANSYLHWYPEYGGGIDFITISGKSGEDGRFEYQEGCPRGTLTLYITSSLTFNNFTPITPPFAYGSRLSKNGRARKIVKSESADLDLGDVKVQTYYSTALIQFTDDSGSKLFSERKDWEKAVFRLRDKSGKLFSENVLPSDKLDKFVRPQDSVIAMDLPEGEWLIEISPNSAKKNWLKFDKPVIVKRSPEPLLVSLKVQKK